jgi:hypothetical protein
MSSYSLMLILKVEEPDYNDNERGFRRAGL